MCIRDSYQTEKSLEEAGDKIDSALKDKITKHLDDLKAAKESNDNAKLKEALDTLNQEWAKLSQEMYSQAPPPNEEESSTNTKKSKDDNVEDADFEVVDDK